MGKIEFNISVVKIAAAISLTALMAIGCGGGGGGSLSNGDRRPTNLFVNGIPDSTGVDFYVDTTKRAANLTYPSITTKFYEPKADDYDIGMRVMGALEDLDVIAANEAVNTNYLFVGVGRITFGDQFMNRARIAPITYDRTVPNGNKARLIVVNGLLQGDEEPLAIDFQDGDLPQFKFDDIAFAGAKAQLVDAGAITFRAQAFNSNLTFAESPLTFGAGKIYLVLISGVRGEAGALAPKITTLEIEAED